MLVILLSACQPEDAPLPTRAQLPTVTASATDSPTPILHPTVTLTATLSPTPTASPTVTLTPTATQTSTATASPTATYTAQPIHTETPKPISIDYDSVYSLSWELRQAVASAIVRDRHLLPDNDYTVSAVRTQDAWAKITLVPTLVIENGWADSHLLDFIEIFAYQVSGQTWDGFLAGSESAQPIPETFANYTHPPLAEFHRFPWREGVAWWATQGWHEGFALDFQPAYDVSTAVLATQSGILREICRDGFQSLLQIDHADGMQTYYMHVRVGGSVRRNLLDQPVEQGQLLGYLYAGQRGQTPCGRAFTPHLHFIASDPALILDGVALEDIAVVATCCKSPPTFTSTNVMKIIDE